MPIVRRQVVMEVRMNDLVLNDVLSFSIQHSLAQPYPKATVVCVGEHGSYNGTVEIRIGTVPGNAAALRFTGFRRDIHPTLYPRATSHDCIGRMGKLAEYYNGDDPSGLGGHTPATLVPGSGQLRSAPAIIIAVLDRVFGVGGVNPSNIHGAHYPNAAGGLTRLYGIHPDLCVWGAGVAPGLGGGAGYTQPRHQGESALDYIHRYNEIEAELSSNNTGGFYRIVEGLNGEIGVIRIGGRPRANPNTDPGSGLAMKFTEGGSKDEHFAPVPGTVNILTANFARQFPIGNRVLVTGVNNGAPLPGATAGANAPAGQVFYEAPSSSSSALVIPNAAGAAFPEAGIVGSDHLYDPSPPSSSMIDHPTIAFAQAAGYGMDCETVARARFLEVGRITVQGDLETAEDWLIEPAQTHIVQGDASGQTDRLRTGEALWVQSVDIRFEHDANGAPSFTQHPGYLGGGDPEP